MNRLLIRADGSPSIGAGHLMRCLALAHAWQDAGGHSQFATSGEAPAIEARLRADRMLVSRIASPPGSAGDAAETAALAQNAAADWVVVDGYVFDAAYQDALRLAGRRVLFLDDYGHAGRYTADLVLNQNLHPDEALYRDRAPSTDLLLGPRFALLRREFTCRQNTSRRIVKNGRRVLVTLGGGDAGQITETVIAALASLNVPKLQAVILAGPANLRAGHLRDLVSSLPFPARLEQSPQNVPELMEWADLAISAAGSTCFELAFLGTPTLAIVCAENQAPGVARLHRAGVVEVVGDWRRTGAEEIAAAVSRILITPEMRVRLRENSLSLVDGRGAQRVIRRMLCPVRFRPVQETDARLLWEWANDRDVRAASFSSEPIQWDAHQAWFRRKRHDPLSIHWIALDRGGTPLGQVRFDRQNESTATIGLSVACEHRATGYGAALLDASVTELLETTGVAEVHAFIKVQNRASLRAFAKAHFRSLGRELIQGCEAEHLLRHGPRHSRLLNTYESLY